MNKCNATVTFAFVRDQCQWEPIIECNHLNCLLVDGEWRQVELHTLTCVDSDCGTRHRNDIYGKTSWRDDTPGAKPHVEPVNVSDDEVEAALAEAIAVGWWMTDPNDKPTSHAEGLAELRRIIAAAKRAAQEDDR